MIDNSEYGSTFNQQSTIPDPTGPVPPPRPSNRNWIVIGIMAFALVAMVYVGLHTANKGGRGGMVGNVRGKTAPDFELTDLVSGQKVKLSDYKGKAVVLNFWATWCPPCKVEIPWFVDLQNQYKSEGLAILSIATDDDASQQEIVQFAQQMGINYPVMKGSEQIDDLYGGVDGLPTTFYIGRDGKLLERAEGLHSHRDIESSIKEALATEPSGNQTAQTVPSNDSK